MFFKKKTISCHACKQKTSQNHLFCPECGTKLISQEEEIKQHGLLGKTDVIPEEQETRNGGAQLGFADKLVAGMMNSVVQALMKNMENQLGQLENAEIKEMPNGFQIRMGNQPIRRQKQPTTAKITAEQLERMAQLPRTQAASNIKRLSDKVIYELAMPGIKDVKDVFVNKLEQGYEIKAIGPKKVYTSSIPLNLPIKSYSIGEKGLTVEFLAK